MDSKYSKHSVHRQRVFLPAQGEHGAANCPERQQKAREKLNILHLQCTHDMRSLVHQKQTVIEVMVIIPSKVKIKQGQIFCLSSHIPHSPQRPEAWFSSAELFTTDATDIQYISILHYNTLTD